MAKINDNLQLNESMRVSIRRSTHTYTKTGTSMTMNTGIRNNNGTRLGTTRVRIQTDSGRIQLNTPRIQDSRFKVQGKLLPGTLNLES